MTDPPLRPPPSGAPGPIRERPRHPTGQAIVLLVAVTALVIFLGFASSLGWF